MKPVKYLVAASMSSLICYTMIMSDMIYYLTYNQGLTSSEASVCLVVRGGDGYRLYTHSRKGLFPPQTRGRRS